MKDKYNSIIKEVLDEIENSLKDSRGIYIHQRRLAFSLSLGASTLLENYLDKKEVLKSGAKINHQWLNKSLKNFKEILSNQIICSVEKIDSLDKFLEIIQKIEQKRNEIIYGKPVSEEILHNLIDLFFELKKEVEND